jgi:hypothetical protein
MEARQLTDATGILSFINGGRAVFTVVSKSSGERRTFKVAAPKDAKPGDALRFVSLLTGPDNMSNYEYVGLLTKAGDDLVARASRGKAPTQPLTIMGWLVKQAQLAARGLPNTLDRAEVWHEGRCCRCGRRLTVPSSIESGIGPECAMRAEALDG